MDEQFHQNVEATGSLAAFNEALASCSQAGCFREAPGSRLCQGWGPNQEGVEPFEIGMNT